MAKGARASVRKTNNKALKSRVFGPAEDARTQRLSAKLLELASQPKPPRAEMDVEKNGMRRQPLSRTNGADTYSAENKEEDEAESKETQHADGALRSLSIPIPSSLQRSAPVSKMLPTPPPTPPLESASLFGAFKPASTSENKRFAKEELFFHLLGVSTDIQGFNDDGNLVLSFGSDTDKSTG